MVLRNHAVLWFRRHALIIAVLVLGAVVHAVNMFGFPAYREDEGTYLSQAQSVLTEGRLAPYTYWYDHTPVGWFFLALWNLVTGNVLVTGMSLDAARVSMLVLQVLSTWLLYLITKRLTRRPEAALIAAVIFAVAPLGIVFHRRVLLDNIMVFWFLLSFYLITKPITLRTTMLSALTFAIAVLSKESAIVFFPVMVWLVATHAHRNNKLFAVTSWITVSALLISFYPLFALLKGELFPSGTWLGGEAAHVSLWEAISFQYYRGGGLLNTFLYSWDRVWQRYGMVSLLLGVIAVLINAFRYKRPWQFGTSLMVTIYSVVFVLRGQILDWYIIPLLPLFALSIAFVWDDAMVWLSEQSRYWYVVRGVSFAALMLVVFGELAMHGYIFTLPQTQNQAHAVAWVKEHMKSDDFVLIDNYAFVDLNPRVRDITKTNYHYYWKVDTDPQVKDQLLKGDWNNIDYLLTTPALERTIYTDQLTLVQRAYENSHVVKRFNAYNILNEGYPVEIREVNNQNSTLRTSWRWYKETYITPQGRVIDNKQRDITTSEAQSYALLRAVWEGDRDTFDRVLSWTNANMQQAETALFAWLYGPDASGGYGIIDNVTATDADEDIALALLFAHKRWDEPQYLTQAEQIIQSIWEHEIVPIQGTYYVTAGQNAARGESYLINPSYFSPATYRLFAEVDTTHPWDDVARDVYKIVERLHIDDTGERTPLIPNWFLVTLDGRHTKATEAVVPDSTLYGYDAFRLMWRIALDAVWFDTPAARRYLADMSAFYEKEWQDQKKIYSVYTPEGQPVVAYHDISTDIGALSAFLLTKPELAIDVYTTNVWPQFQNGYWGSADNYYNQNWGWFGTALYANNLPNLWNEGKQLAAATAE